jgi:hypothetical protein
MCVLNGLTSVKTYIAFERHIIVIGWSYYTTSNAYVEALCMNNNVYIHFIRTYKHCISKQQPP